MREVKGCISLRKSIAQRHVDWKKMGACGLHLVVQRLQKRGSVKLHGKAQGALDKCRADDHPKAFCYGELRHASDSAQNRTWLARSTVQVKPRTDLRVQLWEASGPHACLASLWHDLPLQQALWGRANTLTISRRRCPPQP